MSVSTHVLDSVTGRPAAGVAVALFAGQDLVAEGATDGDGRCRLVEGSTGAGPHRLVLATGTWFAGQGREAIYPEVALRARCPPGDRARPYGLIGRTVLRDDVPPAEAAWLGTPGVCRPGTMRR